MQLFQIRILRTFLIGLIVLVSLSVLVNLVQTRRHRRDVAKPAGQILSPELLRSAETLEFSSNEKGVLKFNVRAKKLQETRQGKRLLEGVHAMSFNPDGSVRSDITSQNGEYDEKGKQMFFTGAVRLHIGQNVELRMEWLHYDIGNQTGASDDRVQLTSSQASGTAKGVRYDNAKKTTELLSEVDFLVKRRVAGPDGSVKVEDYHFTAQHGFYSEEEHVIRLLGAAHIVSPTSSLSGDGIDAAFSADQKHLTGLSSQGNAVYESNEQGDVRTLHGDRLDLNIEAESQVLESIHIQGQAGFALKSPGGDQSLSANEIQINMDPVKGLPHIIESKENVRFEVTHATQRTAVSGSWLEAVMVPGGNTLESMEVRDHASMSIGTGAGLPDELQAEDIRISFRNLEGRSVPGELKAEKAVQWKSPGRSPSESGRLLTSSSLTMHYSETGEALEWGIATGGVSLTALPKPGTAGTQLRRLQSDRVDFSFYNGNNRLQRLTGEGHVQVAFRSGETGASAEEFHTTSNSIRAQFREADGSAESIHQTGGFTYQDGTRTAKSDTCDFSAATEKLMLTDHPSINETDYSASGEIIEYDRKGKLLTVRRNVRSVLKSTAGKSQGFMTSSADSSSPTVVTADEMLYWNEQDKASYSGNVNLLSPDSQLQAQSLLILNKGSSVEAGGGVRHLILRSRDVNQGKPAKEKQPAVVKKDDKKEGGGPILIRCAQLQYSQSSNSIHYAGGVYLDSADAKVWSDSMDAYLDSAGKAVERAVSKENLRLIQAGREVKGDQGEYFLAGGKFIVTGNPAQIVGRDKQIITAPRLTIYTADDRIEAGR